MTAGIAVKRSYRCQQCKSEMIAEVWVDMDGRFVELKMYAEDKK